MRARWTRRAAHRRRPGRFCGIIGVVLGAVSVVFVIIAIAAGLFEARAFRHY